MSSKKITLKGPFYIEHIHEPHKSQANFYMEIPFSHIADSRISIANLTLINKCSGRMRHLGEVKGVRVIDEKIITKPEEMYVFHWEYERHFKELGIINDAGIPTKLAIVNGNRDLGNNDWHIAWQHNPPENQYVIEENGKISGPLKQDRLVRLKDEPYTQRTYNCLIVPHQGHPYIKNVRFNEKQDVIDPETGDDISSEINWLTYGKPMVRDSKVVDVREPKIIAQFGGDIRHILDLSDDEATIYQGDLKGIYDFSEREPKSIREVEILNWIYTNYPEEFTKRAIQILNRGKIGRASYYFNVVGIKEDSLVICHRQGTLEEVGEYLIKKHRVQEAVILDEGGSIACWASWHGPRGGFISISSYFRPWATSCIAFILKNDRN